jgi:hypothetical protein
VPIDIQIGVLCVFNLWIDRTGSALSLEVKS